LSKKIEIFGHQTVTNSIREVLDKYRKLLKAQPQEFSENQIIQEIFNNLEKSNQNSLINLINASGVIINTNLGRVPLSEKIFLQAQNIVCGYNNLEFDLDSAKRGERNVHLKNILCKITDAEDVLVVNNAAAAVLLCLNTFAKRKEVLVSRGELVEIGGSFRIPEVMKAAACKMIEIGSTNKTKLSDYENSINEKTAIIFKAHQSNFVIKGFTEEVSVLDLVKLGKKYNLPVIYDNGSGLLEKSEFKALKNQIDVKSCIKDGADLVIFSGDKLLGGPQAGIILGKKSFIKKLEKNQLLRALRVDKTTIALLEASCKLYLNKKDLYQHNFIFKTLSQTQKELKTKAEFLQKSLKENKILSEIIPNKAMIGGGTSPENQTDSFALKVIFNENNKKQNSEIAVKVYKKLMKNSIPIVGILRKGELVIDIITCDINELKEISQALSFILKNYPYNKK
jgi:L-seryl-tRNA(Ser) seleniumtransferase